MAEDKKPLRQRRAFIWCLALFYWPRTNKWYERARNGRGCSMCGKKCKRGMVGIRGPNAGRRFCARCYLEMVPREVDRALAKTAAALAVVSAILLGLLVASALQPYVWDGGVTIRYDFGSELRIDEAMKERIVDYFFDLLRKEAKRDNISRGQIRIQVEAALKTRFPLLMLAIIYRESLFDPAAQGKEITVVVKGKKIKVRCRGNAQINPTWVPRLIAEGIINEEADLHDPGLGPVAGDWVLCWHLEQRKGDMLGAVVDYVGSTVSEPLKVQYVNDVYKIYGQLRILMMSAKKGGGAPTKEE